MADLQCHECTTSVRGKLVGSGDAKTDKIWFDIREKRTNVIYGI